MKQDKILNSKDKKHLFQMMREQWGTETEVLRDLVFIRKPSGKIFICNKDAAMMEQDMKVRIYSLGNYFGKEEKDSLRVSIEGSQLIGRHSDKNVLELDDAKIKEWIKGEDVDVPDDHDGFCLVKQGKDFFGCGNEKRGKLLNHIPKARRIKNMA
ncbi:MAG: methyltransferase RsmF C-terminal domain-like protein [Candidatus Woesearchaeota archaeon]